MSTTYTNICMIFRKIAPENYSYAKPSNNNYTLTMDFLTYNAMPGTLLVSNFDVTVVFPEHLPAKVCEDVYTTLWFWKPIGISLLTNRQDLFVKERLIINEVSVLQSKKWKYKDKLRKIDGKLEELINSLEV